MNSFPSSKFEIHAQKYTLARVAQINQLVLGGWNQPDDSYDGTTGTGFLYHGEDDGDIIPEKVSVYFDSKRVVILIHDGVFCSGGYVMYRAYEIFDREFGLGFAGPAYNVDLFTHSDSQGELKGPGKNGFTVIGFDPDDYKDIDKLKGEYERRSHLKLERGFIEDYFD
ncbi:hypothetical protein K440DRAFT_610071 [Wilcoxina mikolae CBS 423.85]|nr:hypothetical protein K440DRAFT_610071 [Wilcoxina mikolae CBS 423.85]